MSVGWGQGSSETEERVQTLGKRLLGVNAHSFLSQSPGGGSREQTQQISTHFHPEHPERAAGEARAAEPL